MLNIQTHLWAGPGFKILRSVVWVFLIGAFMTMNDSHAQVCTGTPVITTTQTLPPTMAFSFVNQTKILGSYEATVTLSGCSPDTSNTLQIFIATPEAMSGGNNQTITGTQYKMVGERVSCFVINYCFNSVGTTVRNLNFISTGISHEFTAQFNGLDNLSKECIASLSDLGTRNDFVSGSGGVWKTKRLQINFINNPSASSVCSKITIKVTGKFTQFNAFYTIGVQTIRLRTADDASPNFRFVIQGINPSQLAPIDLISVPATLTSQAGTCALSLSPTALNMGNFTPAQVTAIAQGNAVSTKPLAITIGNCTGFPAGKNKVLQWTFAKPSADLTQMTNAAVLSPSQGLSAEILADQKFTLDAIPVAMGSNKVKSGENYITSGKTNDNQTLNYTVRLVRNSQTVTIGGFTSTATVTMSYK